MGHNRLGSLLRTHSWNEVVALIEHGAAVHQVAHATIRAAEKGLRQASHDTGTVETVWLLTQLPHAAHSEHFRDTLARRGLQTPDDPGLMDFVAAFSDAIDARLANNRGRTDLGELAQTAAAEALVGVLAGKTRGLFDPAPADFRRALAGLRTVVPFGYFARAFFTRLTFKALDYFLSRVLFEHVGEGRRFLTLARLAEFTTALETHCHEAAYVVERFSGEWVSKTRYEQGEITHAHARDLTHGAMAKLIQVLKRGAGLDGE